jgi:hypothetical protein
MLKMATIVMDIKKLYGLWMEQLEFRYVEAAE